MNLIRMIEVMFSPFFKGGTVGGMNDQHPVTYVDWSSVMVWCNALTEYYNQSNGSDLKPVYKHDGAVVRDASDKEVSDSITMVQGADGFRLPTGTEWELVARYTTSGPEGKYEEFSGGSGIYAYSAESCHPFRE